MNGTQAIHDDNSFNGCLDDGAESFFAFLQGIQHTAVEERQRRQFSEGGSQPELFITAERQRGGTYLMRMVAERAEQDLAESPNWNDLENFCLDALLVVKKLLNLMDEQPIELT